MSDIKSKLEIPIDLLKLNPTIDPVLQNSLYTSIKIEGVENWILINDEKINPNFYNPFLKKK